MQQFIYLFDCDGVVLDTESQYRKFWAHIGTLYYPQMQSFAEDIKGMSLVDIFDRYFPDASQQKELKLLLDVFEESMEYAYIPGVEEFLKSLRDKKDCVQPWLQVVTTIRWLMFMALFQK